jgi:hypothetical protein
MSEQMLREWARQVPESFVRRFSISSITIRLDVRKFVVELFDDLTI